MTRSPSNRFWFWSLLVVAMLACALGNVEFHPWDVLRVALHGLGLIDASDVPFNDRYLLLEVRFPQVAVLALAGGALAICGAALQSTFQNPLAAPGVLGISGGGALGAVTAIFLGSAADTYLALPVFAFCGALASGLLVYALAFLGGRPTTTSLVLTGVAVSALASAGISLILTTSEVWEMRRMLFWMIGGAEGRSWDHVRLCAAPILLGSLTLCAMHRRLDGLTLGEEHALSVGVAVTRARLQLLALCALVAGAAVAVVGAITFVGLIVPHILRMLTGVRARNLLPATFLGGATFVVLCDLIARLLSGAQEIKLGIVTAFLGGPYFLFLLYRTKRSVA